MNDKLKELLIRLLQAQATTLFTHDYTERDNIRATILSEFSTLRQQRDELAEVCRDLISAWNSALSFDVAKTVGKARAALASIEGDE